jgi:hypothetical protein
MNILSLVICVCVYHYNKDCDWNPLNVCYKHNIFSAGMQLMCYVQEF